MNIYSFNDYFNLFNYFFYAARPVAFIAGLIGICFYFKKIIKHPLLNFLIILLFFDVLLKIFKFYKTGILTERYLLISSFILITFAFYGLYFTSNFLAALAKLVVNKLPKWINSKSILFLMITIPLCNMIVQTFLPRFNKPWINDVAKTIECIDNKPERTVIITNGNDVRVGYNAKAKMLKLNLYNFRFSDSIDFNPKNKNIYLWKTGINNFYKNINKLKEQSIFLFIENMRPEDFEKLFIKQDLPFKFKLLKKYLYKRRKTYCLYIYETPALK